jgi:hypothetical protein
MARKRSGEPVFVVHKHAASSLHYDFRVTRTGGGRRERWLLVKRRDDGADARRNPVSTQPESVLTGRTIEQVAQEAS